MSDTRLRRNAVAVDLNLTPQGVLMVSLKGPLTGEALQYVKRVVKERWGEGRALRAFVVDFRSALLALDGAALDAVLMGEAPGATPTRPAAMLATSAQVDLLQTHAMRMALLGHFRRVFTDPRAAQAWALAMADR